MSSISASSSLAQMPPTHAHTQSRCARTHDTPTPFFLSRLSTSTFQFLRVWLRTCLCVRLCVHPLHAPRDIEAESTLTPYRMALRLAGSQFFGRMNELAQLLFFCREVSVDGLHVTLHATHICFISNAWQAHVSWLPRCLHHTAVKLITRNTTITHHH
jgi:hypothetical protein